MVELLNRFEMEEVLEYGRWMMEFRSRYVMTNHERDGRIVDQNMLIVDLAGLGRHHLGQKTINVLQASSKMGQDYYPERMGNVVVVNAGPRVVRVAWGTDRGGLDQGSISHRRGGGVTPCVTFRRVVVPLRGPGRSPVLPFACCVRSLRSVGRCSRCSCWCRFRVREAQSLVCWGAVCASAAPNNWRITPSPLGPPPPPPPPSQTKVTILGKNEIHKRENLVRPFLVLKILGPRPPHSPFQYFPGAEERECSVDAGLVWGCGECMFLLDIFVKPKCRMSSQCTTNEVAPQYIQCKPSTQQFKRKRKPKCTPSARQQNCKVSNCLRGPTSLG